jgi:hypothetical protein
MKAIRQGENFSGQKLTIGWDLSDSFELTSKDKRDRPPPRLIGPVSQPPWLSGSGATVDSDSRHGNGSNVGSSPLQRVIGLAELFWCWNREPETKNCGANDLRCYPKSVDATATTTSPETLTRQKAVRLP